MSDPERKTCEQWIKETEERFPGFKVIEFAGRYLPNFHHEFYERKFTKKEFLDRLTRSTLEGFKRPIIAWLLDIEYNE